MPHWLDRTTKEYLKSVSEAKLPKPVSQYIKMPDLSAVDGQPVKYWEINGDVVTLADQATRDAIDASLEATRRDAIADEIDVVSISRAIALLVRQEINTLRQQFNDTTAETNQLTNTAFNQYTPTQVKNAIRALLDL